MSNLDPATLKAMFGGMREEDLLQNVRRMAILGGWLFYHTRDSRGSDRGFPDVVLARDKRVMFRELKTQTGNLTPEQQEWGRVLLLAGQDYAVWRPFDWGTERIMEELR